MATMVKYSKLDDSNDAESESDVEIVMNAEDKAFEEK